VHLVCSCVTSQAQAHYQYTIGTAVVRQRSLKGPLTVVTTHCCSSLAAFPCVLWGQRHGGGKEVTYWKFEKRGVHKEGLPDPFPALPEGVSAPPPPRKGQRKIEK